MLKKSPVLIAAACSLCAALALAQEAPPVEKVATTPNLATEKKADEAKPADHSTDPKPAPKPTPKPTPSVATIAPIPEVVATPAPKKPSFFQRLFGKRKPAATSTPTPAPTATPSPTPRKVVVRKVPATTPVPMPEPSTTPKPGKTVPVKTDKPAPPVSPDKASATLKPVKPAATPKLDMPKAATATPVPPTKKVATTKPAITEPKEPKKTQPEPPADADPDVKEKYRFEQAKAKAMEDSQVKSLKAKADDASTDEESRKALRAYNKALFEKIRKIDNGVSERADRLEAAILKRLSE
jgi:DnaK suppressor protein